MTTKKTEPRTARSLTTILATRIAVLINVVAAIYASFAVYYAYTTHQQNLTTQQQLIALEAGNTVSSFLQNKFSTMETAVGLVDLVGANRDTQTNLLDGLLGQDQAFRQFALFNSRGRQLTQAARVSSSLSSGFIAQLKDEVFSKTLTGEHYISTVYIDDATNEPLIAIAIPIKDVFGEFQGTLVGEVNLKFMWDLVDRLKVGETGYVYVVDNQGNLIAFGDTSRVLAGENLAQVSEVQEFIENPSAPGDITPEIASYSGLRGDTVVGTYVPLGTPQWAVVTELPASEANRPLLRLLLINGIAVFVATILGGLSGFLLARLLTAPVVDLSAVATQIANGNLAVEAKVAGAAEVAQVATAFNIMTSRLRELIGSLEQRVADRTKALATSTEVSRRLSTILDRKELVNEVVNQVRNAFGYYHTQIYFYDEARENLVMAGGTGEAGEKMLAQFHKITKGRGLVGRAAETNEPILVSDTASNPDWLPNVLLPETKSEVAIPISIGDRVLGVLDIQHNIVDGLKREDIDALQSISNQVAIAVQNAQSYTEIQRSQSQLSEALEIAKLANWEFDVARDRFIFNDHFYSIFHTTAEREGGYELSSAEYAERLVHPEDLPMVGGEIEKALKSTDRHYNVKLEHRILYRDGSGMGYITVDVHIERDDQGHILRYYGANQDITERRRLEELNRKRAAQQEAINLITQKIQSAGTIETALKVAARELGHALGMKPTLVELDSTPLADKRKSAVKNEM
ncbi:Methyl-accepting chemotaxis protein PctB [Anaerolineales bacterium]|nr:Methyl-accepting chemotaxis protein PctB [Anaerolineales bacterium]